MDRVLVGLDLGTSSLKAVALDPAGAVLARSRVGYPTHRPEPGAAEQDIKDWWRAAAAAVAALAQVVDPDRWAGIGLSGMLPTLVALDEQARPVGPALTWQDARAEAEGEGFRRRAGARHYARTGQWVDGRYLVPMMERFAQSSPEVAAARRLCGAKDALFAHLTGELLTDPSTATGYGCYDLAGGWDPATSPGSWALPDVAPSLTARPMRADLAVAWGLPPGLPVVLGAADSVLGAYALSHGRPGEIAYLAGTSTVILGPVAADARDQAHRFLVTPLAAGGYGAEMDLLATGSGFGWLADLLGLSGPPELARLAADVPPKSAPVLLPYLAPGEQGALWDPTLTGAVTGLHLGTTRGQLARALQTGIVLESARCLAVLDQAGRARTVDVAGEAVTASFAQDLADATSRPVRRHAEPDQSAIGAAWLVGRALELLAPATPRTAPGVEEHRPDPRAAATWRQLFDRHESTRAALFDRPARPEETPR